MQMDDILKAAIQDAGLEFFNTTTTYSSPSSNSSESSLNNLGLDDDFNLTDLDWNLLDNSEESPPTSISPSQCSIQSPAVLSIHNTNNDTCQSIADDTDPFILALQELDDHNIKLDHVSTPPYFENNNQYNNSNKQYLNKQESSIKTITKPEPIKPEILSTKKDCLINKHENKKIEILNKPHTKIVKFNSSSSKTNVTKILPNAKGSDLLSLINYRATSIVNKPNSQVFEIFKFNRGWKTRLWCLSPTPK